MNQYKSIKLSNNVLADLQTVQKVNESIYQTLKRLYEKYSDWIEYVGVPDFHKEWIAGGAEIVPFVDLVVEIDVESGKYQYRYEYITEDLTNVLRLPKEILDEWDFMRIHPDETYNTTIFKLIYINRAIEEYEQKQSKIETNMLSD